MAVEWQLGGSWWQLVAVEWQLTGRHVVLSKIEITYPGIYPSTYATHDIGYHTHTLTHIHTLANMPQTPEKRTIEINVWNAENFFKSMRIIFIAVMLGLIVVAAIMLYAYRRRPIVRMRLFFLSLMQLVGMFILAIDALVIETTPADVYECIIHVGLVHAGFVLLFWSMLIQNIRQWYIYVRSRNSVPMRSEHPMAFQGCADWSMRCCTDLMCGTCCQQSGTCCAQRNTEPDLQRFFERHRGRLHAKFAYGVFMIILTLHFGLAIWDMARRADAAATVGRFECEFQHNAILITILMIYIVLTIWSACLNIITQRLTQIPHPGTMTGFCGGAAWALFLVMYIMTSIGESTNRDLTINTWAPSYVWLLLGIGVHLQIHGHMPSFCCRGTPMPSYTLEKPRTVAAAMNSEVTSTIFMKFVRDHQPASANWIPYGAAGDRPKSWETALEVMKRLLILRHALRSRLPRGIDADLHIRERLFELNQVLHTHIQGKHWLGTFGSDKPESLQTLLLMAYSTLTRISYNILMARSESIARQRDATTLRGLSMQWVSADVANYHEGANHGSDSLYGYGYARERESDITHRPLVMRTTPDTMNHVTEELEMRSMFTHSVADIVPIDVGKPRQVTRAFRIWHVYNSDWNSSSRVDINDLVPVSIGADRLPPLVDPSMIGAIPLQPIVRTMDNEVIEVGELDGVEDDEQNRDDRAPDDEDDDTSTNTHIDQRRSRLWNYLVDWAQPADSQENIDAANARRDAYHRTGVSIANMHAQTSRSVPGVDGVAVHSSTSTRMLKIGGQWYIDPFSEHIARLIRENNTFEKFGTTSDDQLTDEMLTQFLCILETMIAPTIWPEFRNSQDFRMLAQEIADQRALHHAGILDAFLDRPSP